MALAQLSGFAYVSKSIKPEEVREKIYLHDVPIVGADQFPLADDDASIDLRKKAIASFKKCAELANSLDALEVEKLSKRFCLWLELRDIDTHDVAKQTLKEYFLESNLTEAILYLPLAYAFKIDNINYDAIELFINQQTALKGDIDIDLGVARFILVYIQKSPENCLSYIRLHRNQLRKAINPVYIDFIEIEFLARSDLIPDAEHLLHEISIKEDYFLENQMSILKDIIAVCKKEANPISIAIERYKNDNSIGNLDYLVSVLENTDLKEEKFLYALELFKKTETITNALKVAEYAKDFKKFTFLYQFLLEKNSLVKKSNALQYDWVYCLFRKGDVKEAQKQLSILPRTNEQEKIACQALEVNIAIYSGNWSTIGSIVEQQWNIRESLNPEQLLWSAQLAKAYSLERTKEFLECVTDKNSDNAEIKCAAYFIANTIGWEKNKKVASWFQHAMKHSDENTSSLRKVSLVELKEILEDNKDLNQKVYQMYNHAEIPTFLAAKSLNKSLVDFYLLNSLHNSEAIDVRNKRIIPVFFHKRNEASIPYGTLLLDISSSLILSLMGIFETLFETYEKIFIPHSFMRALYEEKEVITFHQPSQILEAEYIESLVADEIINVFVSQRTCKHKLGLEVGNELAELLEEAASYESEGKQALVAHPYPIYKISTFLEEEADLSEYKQYLITSVSLVKKLKDLSIITEDEYQKYSHYLNLQEGKWEDLIEIDDSAVVFLDELSVSYLIQYDILEKFKETDLKLYIHKNVSEKYKRLRKHSKLTEKIKEKIESIRYLINVALENGKVEFAEMQDFDFEEVPNHKNGTYFIKDFLQASKVCDAALIDDVFINRHMHVNVDEKNIPIYTTLDYLHSLYKNEKITKEEWFQHKTSLRKFGFGFIPFSREELNFHLEKSVIKNGEFSPSKELKLIQENLFLIKLSGQVKFPHDVQWWYKMMKEIALSLKAQWKDDISTDISRCRSEWLYKLLDIRSWAQSCEIRDDNGGIIHLGDTIRVNSLTLDTENTSLEVWKEYNKWLEEYTLRPLEFYDPVSYKNLIGLLKKSIIAISEDSIPSNKEVYDE